MKRIITVQDISCVGKCSLTVALPILSAAGVECGVLPTAVLSTHTAFPQYTFHDLTGEIQPIADTLRTLGIGFDAVYTGYLGSAEQLSLMERFFRDFKKKDTFVLVDPVMADNGKLYPGFTEEFAARMAGLCAQADMILPNLTEASCLLRIPYREQYDEAYIRQILRALTALGPRYAAISGVSYAPDRIGAALYDRQTDRYFSYFNQKLPVSFHGTGDIFASCLLGGVMRGMTVEESLALAVDFTLEAMLRTQSDPEARTYGVNFEEALPWLINRLQKAPKQG